MSLQGNVSSIQSHISISHKTQTNKLAMPHRRAKGTILTLGWVLLLDTQLQSGLRVVM